jgi:hypothetical protein
MRMNLRTTFNIELSPLKITHNDPVMFIGSCFASSIGTKVGEGRIPVMINPSGTVYNPVSVSATIDALSECKIFTDKDLYNNKGTWLSFDHYTDFSSIECEKVVEAINAKAKEALSFISSARFLFITFGTARVYRFRKSGKIVSNCHKIPANEFNRELLTVSDIVDIWVKQLDYLKKAFPKLKVIFSVSPVRHLKDGAHENQVSKSTLFLAIEELLRHETSPGYFPAYELLMDDLRDYRFYDDDMLHPSSSAVDYIWESFARCYFSNKTMDLWSEISGVSKAISHKIRSGAGDQTRKFAENMISKIDAVCLKAPSIDLSSERDYFKSLL